MANFSYLLNCERELINNTILTISDDYEEAAFTKAMDRTNQLDTGVWATLSPPKIVEDTSFESLLEAFPEAF